jgi:hypothetical protein
VLNTTSQPLQLTFWEGIKILSLTLIGLLGIAVRLFGWLPAWNTQQNKPNVYRTSFLVKLGAGAIAAILAWLWLASRIK